MKPEQILVLGSYADGGVAVIAFVTKSFREDGSVHWTREPSPEAISYECARISEHTPSPIVRWRIIDESEIPPSREYRDAWTDLGRGRGLGYDLGRARANYVPKLMAVRERARKAGLVTADDEPEIAAEVAKLFTRPGVSPESPGNSDADSRK